MLLRQGPRPALHRLRSLRSSIPTTRLSLTTYHTLGLSKTVLSARQDSHAPSSKHPTRSLATAVDGSLFESRPFDGSASPMHGFEGSSNAPYYELRPFDVSQPLQLDDPAPAIQRLRMNRQGISGDVEELVAVVNACLQVQKLDRAQLVLKRLAQFDEFPRDQLVALHNTFLRASLEQMRLTPDKTGSEDLHKWYELQIRRPGLPQTAETVACCLNGVRGSVAPFPGTWAWLLARPALRSWRWQIFCRTRILL